MRTNAAVALLLEDEPLIAIDLEQALDSAGFQVTTVMSCAEANDWLAMCRPDIIIVDIMLRDGSSDEVVKRLVEAAIPFIVHSGDLPNQHVGTPFAYGVWVSKPAGLDELVETVRALVA